MLYIRGNAKWEKIKNAFDLLTEFRWENWEPASKPASRQAKRKERERLDLALEEKLEPIAPKIWLL